MVWYVLVSDSPSNHPRIKKEEKEYIQDAIGETVSNKKVKNVEGFMSGNNSLNLFFFQSLPPFLSLMTSLPFLALNVLHYGNMWGMFFLLTAAPKFMSEVSQISFSVSVFKVGNIMAYQFKGTGFQIVSCWHSGKFTLFGTIRCWFRFRSHR